MTYFYKMKSLLFLILSLSALSVAHASDSLRTETQNGKQVMVYRVEQGQTLYSISRKFGISVNEIKALNPSMGQLKTGSELFLPTKNQNTQTVAKTENPGTDHDPTLKSHVVKQGETLYKISKMYNVSAADITKANDLSRGLKIGQELVIPTKEAVTNYASSINTTNPATTPTSIKTEKKTSATGYPSISETGSARFDVGIGNEDNYSVFHKTAIIGTLVLIKNKENGNTAHAKVVGNTKSGEACLVLMNKKVTEKLESSSNLLVVEIFYTPEQ